MAPRQLFRTKALERASSPDRLDQIIEIVSPKDWLPLVVLGVLLVLAIGWGIAGRVPTTVSGRGILIHPRRVVDVQALGSGRLEMLTIRTGDLIRAGDVLARLDQFDLRRRVNEDRTLLADLRGQDRAKSAIQSERAGLQRQHTQLEASFVKSQAESLRKSLADAEALAPSLKERLEALRTMRGRGLLAQFAPELIEAERAFLANNTSIIDASARLMELNVQQKQSETQESGVTNEHLASDTARRNQMQEVASRTALNEQQLQQYSQISSSRSGRVLEVFAAEGQIIAAGTRIATIEADGPDATLLNVSYFTVGDGKKILPGMRVQVTPDTAERQRFGGITGVVTSVSPLPVTMEGSRALVGNSEIVQGLMQGSARIEVTATLDADPNSPSGFKWSSSSGPPMPITAGLTNSMRVTVETRAPITYVLPFLREITGVY